MSISTLYKKVSEGGLVHTRSFDSVIIGLGITSAGLLGKIVGYCSMGKDNICTKSQDELAFAMGISISTCKRALDKLVREGLVFSKTLVSHVPQKLSIDEKAIREFDANYNKSLRKFYEIEKEFIANADDETFKIYVVTGDDGSKVLRRYVNMYYDNGSWYVKMANKEYTLTEFEVF